METKICKICNIEKNTTDFHKRKNGLYGVFTTCKSCRKEIKFQKYRENSDEMRLKSKLWRQNNPEKRKEVSANYRIKNKEKIKISDKEYRERNKEKEQLRLKIYYQNNKEKVLKRNIKYNKNRLVNDDFFRVKTYIRSRINKFLKSKNINKNNRTFDIVGCSPEFLKNYLEERFTEGISWELMGKYIHIDHIMPLSSAKSEEEVYKLCHYTNLQPLWAEENLRKSNKII